MYTTIEIGSDGTTYVRVFAANGLIAGELGFYEPWLSPKGKYLIREAFRFNGCLNAQDFIDQLERVLNKKGVFIR